GLALLRAVPEELGIATPPVLLEDGHLLRSGLARRGLQDAHRLALDRAFDSPGLLVDDRLRPANRLVRLELHHLRLSGFPLLLAHLFDLVSQHVAADHAADHHVRLLVAVDIDDTDLPPDPGFAVDLVRDPIHAVLGADELEPVDHRPGVPHRA